jgi:hypothetical protein
MHHPVQYQVTAKNIQKDRLKAAQASRLASQSGPGSSRFIGLSFKLLGLVRALLTWSGRLWAQPPSTSSSQILEG